MITSLRCLLVWLAVTAASSATAWWSLASVRPSHTFDTVVINASGYALAACTAWAWSVCTLVVIQVLGAHGLPLGRVPGVPGWAARAVLMACGLAALSVVPAQASYEVPLPATATPDGLPFPDRAVGPAHAKQARRDSAPRADAPVPTATGTVVVRPGDSLWRIAAASLGPDASDAEVVAATTALHDLNRHVVGPDPDLIHPGLRLRTSGS